MSAFLPDDPGTWPDAHLRHWIINSRAQLKRRKLGARVRARTELRMPLFVAEAERRGLDTSGWRDYPDRDAPFTFGARVNVSNGAIEHVRPPQQKRKPKPKPAPPATPSAHNSTHARFTP